MLNDPFDAMSIGTDTDEDDPVVVARARKGQPDNMHILLPLSMKKQLSEEARSIVADMQSAVVQIQRLQEQIDQAVVAGREEGMSWAAIGWSVGLTAEGARKKWSNPDG